MIFLTSILECKNKESYTEMLGLLPSNQKTYIEKYTPEVAHKKLTARLLLYCIMKDFGRENLFKTLHHAPNGKLKCDENLFFSLSYAGDYIACGITENEQCGIDIVQKNPLKDLGNSYYLNQADNQSIARNNYDFYFYHSRYEALLKAGFIKNWQALDFSLQPDSLIINNQQIQLFTTNAQQDIIISMAGNVKQEECVIIQYSLSEIYSRQIG